ncbi:protein FLOURY 1-like [Morus notabilis]|uniref:protein FLOURY 1-like n=1 Tax=Morus notabilis TaxID=981085 RepID=UPI000CED58DA|nr:protein FLOURY 1-like [Morus notabilis]
MTPLFLSIPTARSLYDGEEDGGEDCNEDEEFNVMALRKMVKIERGRARKVRKELEKERLAAASAAEEAMAMILRLQSERSSVEMEANQYRRMAEQKQVYNEGIIQSLQWIVAKHEEERSGLEDQLRLCRRKLKIFMKESEKDESEEDHMTSTLEDYSPLDDMGSVVSSLDFDG